MDNRLIFLYHVRSVELRGDEEGYGIPGDGRPGVSV
jgi:hypothetical protein